MEGGSRGSFQPALEADGWLQATGAAFRQHKETSSTHMRLTLGSCTFRAAFSHVPFIQSVVWMTNTMILQPSPGNLTADTNLPTTLSAGEKASPHCALRRPEPGCLAQLAVLRGTLSVRRASEQEAAAREFRPSILRVDGTMQSLSLVLCNDKPQTFGAPDVLRLTVEQLVFKYATDQRFHDRPPDQVRCLQTKKNHRKYFMRAPPSRPPVFSDATMSCQPEQKRVEDHVAGSSGGPGPGRPIPE